MHTQNTRVKLDEPSICRYGLGTLETERSSVNHIVDTINIVMFTIENYVLEAPLGARPAAGATPDVVNVWQSKADDYSIVHCAMLYGLEPGLQ